MTKFDRVREAVRAVYQHYGRIDGLVNNAGRSYAASIEEIEPEIFDEIFHLNVLGPIIAMQTVTKDGRARSSCPKSCPGSCQTVAPDAVTRSIQLPHA